MNLLLTNDDGFGEEGITVLAEKLSKKHKVFVIAPAGNRSAVSHHFSMYNQLEIKKVGENQWTCSGYPADCVSLGLNGNLINEKIDAVISGINAGGNMGTDIVYSGTCAAARQAILDNVPSVAFSLDPINWGTINEDGFKFNALADFAEKNIEKLVAMAKTSYPRKFVNVNGLSIDSYKGYKFTDSLCKREYHDKIEVIPVESKSDEFVTKFIYGNGNTVASENSDHKVVRDGYISINLVYADPVCSTVDVVDGIKLSL